jgi:hypothetical protein
VVDVRARLADRLAASWRWGRLRGTTSDGIEMHIGPAIAVLFFNDFYPFAAPPRCYLNPSAVDRLDPFIPRLENLVATNPCLFVALVTLNLLEVAPRSSQLPLLLAGADAWLEVYPDDTVFWQSKDIGKRVCAVIQRTWHLDPAAFEPAHRARIDQLLAALVRLGVSEASDVERALARES